MKKEAKYLFQKAIDSLTLSIEIFNRPNCKLPLFLDHFGLEFLGVFSNSRETD